ncbi:hypothetical protein AAF712_014167, partial [Marasmius tenuissimus]
MTEYDFSPDAYRRHMEKQDGVRRWAKQTGQFHPANPFTPTTSAVHAMALKDSGRRSDGGYRDRERSSSGHKKHRSRSTDGTSTPPKPSRSNSYAYAPVTSPLAAYQTSHSRPPPQRSTTMPTPPPRPQPPRRSNTSATTHQVFYRPGASIAIISPQHFASPHQQQQPPRKTFLSKIGSFFSSASSPSSRAQTPNPSGFV